MEWVALITWALVVALALPVGREASAYPPLGVAALAALAGLALAIVFLAVGGSDGVAWGAVGAGAVGLVAAAAGAAWLTSDQHVFGGAAQQRHEETDAGLAGAELPLFGLAVTFALLTALGVATLH